MLKKQEYRRDIDGLRAVAVLMVVLFHGYPRDLPGGFIGVDIFFVISGYLISRAILSQLESGNFSFFYFYQARIRRIFPALMVVLSCGLAIGWFVLQASDYALLGKHVAAGAGFSSNIMLWLESGYFDAEAEKKPLLHLWSLGVEEQFYLIFPFLLLGAYRRGVRGLLLVMAMTAISFVVGLSLVRDEPAAAYFLPHPRLWELMVGALLAWAELRFNNTPARPSLLELRAICGAILVGAGVYAINATRAFPGWWALFPVVGSVLLLSAHRSSINSRILSMRVLVWIGLISYPLYLWHWVLLAFCHIFEDALPFHETRNPAIILSFVLAWLTYKLVEKPIRFGALRSLNSLFLLVPMGLIMIGGWVVSSSHGAPFRSAAKVQVLNEGDIGHTEFNSYMAAKFFTCQDSAWSGEVLEQGVRSRCLQSKAAVASDAVFLLGDSHAEHLFIGLAEAFPERSFLYTTRQGLPLVSNPGFREVFSRVTANKQVSAVVLAAHWVSKLRSMDAVVFERDLADTVRYFEAAGKKVYVLDDVPAFRINPERCAYADRMWLRNACVAPIADMELNTIDFSSIAKRLSIGHPGLIYENLSAYFCDDSMCSMARNGKLFYRDRNHLNVNGSRYVGESLRESNPHLFGQNFHLDKH